MKTIEAFETADGKVFTDEREAAKHDGYLVIQENLTESSFFYHGSLCGIHTAAELEDFLKEGEIGGWVKAMMGWVDANPLPGPPVVCAGINMQVKAPEQSEVGWVEWSQGDRPVPRDIWVYYALHDNEEILKNRANHIIWSADESKFGVKKYRIAVDQDDGFIGWNGGEKPFEGNGIVHVIYKKSGIATRPANTFIWEHQDVASDIIAYKLNDHSDSEVPEF